MEQSTRYAVERDASGNPYLLARLRWPDIAEAVSPHDRLWTTNWHLFNMLYESTGEWVGEDYARELALSWGASFDAVRAVLAKPPKAPNQMTPDELRTWAEGVAAGLKPPPVDA